VGIVDFRQTPATHVKRRVRAALGGGASRPTLYCAVIIPLLGTRKTTNKQQVFLRVRGNLVAAYTSEKTIPMS
jgi:hypothetical protein